MNKRNAIVALVGRIVSAGARYYFTSRRAVSVTSSSVAGSVTRGQTFATWADCLEAGIKHSSSRRKVVFIGVDGAAWNVIDPLIDEGVLPTFAGLKAGGAYGVLRSADCYVSPPAWVAMMTGYLPEKSGADTFGIWDAERRKFVDLA